MCVCVCVCVLRCCCTKGEMPVEAQMVTDGLETNQPGSQDLCPGTSGPLSMFVSMCCMWSVCALCVSMRGRASLCFVCVQYVKPKVCACVHVIM